MTTRHDPISNDPAELPPALASALRAAHTPPAPPPLSLDSAVLARFDRHTQSPFARIGPARWAAAAAAIAVLVGTLVVYRQASRPQADLNRDHRVDILDALALSIAVEEGRTAPDIDRDGVTTQSDARVLAQLAVRLPNGGRS
jgi:hypothetical protein